jgi:hypothetical protein
MTALRALIVAVVAALAFPSTAGADLADETALAERFAPVVRLVEQPEPCGSGEPYEPMDVDLLFGEPTVALRGPWGGGDLVEIGPTAEDLAQGLYEYHLDFPGNALEPGCDFEQWARRLTGDHAPAVYAHVAADPGFPGQIALQYWIFYAYNDWNNLHEGDWEMIQLNFDAATARDALAREPVRVGYSQHEGAEGAEWGDDKLEIVAGTHPVVHPAAGSHANFFGEALYLGSSAEQGVGCDDTRGPTYDVRPTVFTIPSDQAQAARMFPWIEFQGRWGELQPAFFNGPTGPNLKMQWTEPILWSEGWRERSAKVPGGGIFGPNATDFFCRAIGDGSRALVRLVRHPLEISLVVAGLVALLVLGLSRATWRPSAPLRLARRRTWGQILSASGRMYARRPRLFVGIGLVLVPIALLVALFQTIILHGTSILGVQTGGSSDGVAGFLVFALGIALTLLGIGLVQAATARALVAIDEGEPVGPVRAYRFALRDVWPLLGALVVAVVVVSLLASTFFLLPIAVWLAGRLALIAPVTELEGLTAWGTLKRSYRLVRRRWWKVASLITLVGALAFVLGPVIGTFLILGTDAPFWIVNLVAGVVYALTMPFVALTTAYAYFDARVRTEAADERDEETLPAEPALGQPPLGPA